MFYKEVKGINVEYYVMNPDPMFNATSVIINKNGKGILVDTQFSKDDADNIIKTARDKKVDIKTIYISYSDPDYYFGAYRISQEFPKANILATESTISRIKSNYAHKMNVWGETLGAKKPDKILIPEPITQSLNLDGTYINIFGENPKKQTLFIKEDNILLGGVLVATGSHIFMGDTKSVDIQEEWIRSLEELESLKAKIVIPGHFKIDNDFSPMNIQFTKEYIKRFIEVEKESNTSKEIIDKMKQLYPDLPDQSLLEMSSKIVTGEMNWE